MRFFNRPPIFVITSSVLFLFALACGRSVEDDGSCSTSFVDNYNQVMDQTRVVKSLKPIKKNREHIELGVKACDRFFANHAEASCRGMRSSHGTAMLLHSNDLTAQCAEMRSKFELFK